MSNCLIGDVEIPLGEQVLDVSIAQCETATEPNCMMYDGRWKSVTAVRYLAHPETLKHRLRRSHAVNVTTPAWPFYTATWPQIAPPLTETNSANSNTNFLTPSLPAQYIFAKGFL